TTAQNVAFVSSSNTDNTTEPVSAATSVSVIDVDDLEEMDLKWQMAMLTMRARRFLQRTGRNIGANGPTSLGFDMSKVECYNCHKKGHFVKECRYPKDPRRNEEETANYALMAFSSSGSSSDNELRDNALVSLRQTLEKTKQERDDLKLKLEKLQTSSKNLTELLASQTNAKTGLGYNSQVFTRAMFDCDDYLYSESDESRASSSLYDRFQSNDGYHACPPLYTGTFMPPKPDLVFNNAPTDIEADHLAFTVKLSPTKPDKDLSLTNRSSALIIEDWVSDSEDESETKTLQNVPNCDYHAKKMAQPTARNHAHRGNHKQYAQMTHLIPQRHVVPAAVLTQSRLVPITVVPINAVRPISTTVPKLKVTRPKHAKPIVTKTNSPIRWHTNRSTSPKTSNSPPKVTDVKALVGNPYYALKDKRVIDSGCSRHMTRNMSHLSDFEELNGGYVAFGGNPKGGKISGKGSGPTWLFDIDTLTKTMNYQPVTASNQSNPSTGFQDKFDAEKAGEESDQKYVLFPVCFSGSTNSQNTDGDAAFDEKEPEFNEKKPESQVNVSPRSSVQSKKHDDKKRVRLKARVLTNTFSVAGPSNVVASPTHEISSCIDASQLPDNPDMPELEDITYFDDEDVVGAEADFNNLETPITVSPIPTTRVQNDHLVTLVRNKQEKDKIGIKPDQIKKKGKRGKAR
nr:ribonuclease H-like domain-containing protein [Tanacetum cinerariifolium]